MLNRSKVMTQTKGTSWSSRMGVGHGNDNLNPQNICSSEKFLTLERRGYSPPRAVMPKGEKEEIYIYLLVSWL
jgi:hypothetical protein